MTVGIFLAALFMTDPPKNWWPHDVDPIACSRKAPLAQA
jgi:hypothetical protein